MPGDKRIRGRVNAALNRLVAEGVIPGFQTNFGSEDIVSGPRVTISVPAAGRLTM